MFAQVEQDSSVPLSDVPELPQDTVLFEAEKMFGYRGRIGTYVLSPSKVGIYADDKILYEGKPSIRIMYEKEIKDMTFCGAYIIILGDLSSFHTMTFMIRSDKINGAAFTLGMNDTISNKREDAVYIGSVYRYLANGITTEWQKVIVPLSDFFGPNLEKVYSIVFEFIEPGPGQYWIADLRFHKDNLINRQNEISQKGYLLLNDFDHPPTYLNLLGRKSNVYKKLPSVCKYDLTTEKPYRGARCLELKYDKKATGWCGYYTLLNQVDGEYYDLSGYKSVAFMIRGARGGEKFEIGMADKSWVIIGDSLKAGSIDKYLPKGVTTEWQEVVIPLEDFGQLDLTQMGSFVINLTDKDSSTLYIDDLKFILKTEAELLEGWDF